ncbi:hypothetical protein [Knoellia sp. LjRoot47]|uniref:hypothetical protein n=1 Tax=Knoellia sp. LjRoot47 TaxID=3342330 RepID=UPI003ECE4CEF
MTDTAPAYTPEDVAQLEHMVEVLEDAVADAMLAAEDRGWSTMGDATDGAITRERLLSESRRARVMAVADPLIRRGVSLRTAYVWGQGVAVEAKQDDNAGQDVNAVVQAFLDDDTNAVSFTSAQAREELERRFATDGEAFHCLVTAPRTGRVQVRVIPHREIVDIITDPEDADTIRFYKREHVAKVVEADASGGTVINRETRTTYYPDLRFRPTTRARTIDGHRVEWDKPVLHTAVNRQTGSLWGVPDLYAALPWADGYKGFLLDWAKLVKALSRFAFQVTAKNRRGGAAVRDRISAGAGDGAVGQTVVTGQDQSISAIGKSGATIDSESGRPLASMVGAALDLPVTMLLTDPGVTGARATAETLDQPMRLMVKSRQRLHADLIATILHYVIDQAIKAPAGALRGTIGRNPFTGREVLTLAGDQDRSLDVTFPDVDDANTAEMVKAIVEAAGTELLPELTLARLLLQALDVEDVDEVLKLVTDADGNFIYPADRAAATSQQDAVRDGDVPQD